MPTESMQWYQHCQVALIRLAVMKTSWWSVLAVPGHTADPCGTPPWDWQKLWLKIVIKFEVTDERNAVECFTEFKLNTLKIVIKFEVIDTENALECFREFDLIKK